jgi:predicted RNA binding protein YcfA (HicA-like mRNA interferase family)
MMSKSSRWVIKKLKSDGWYEVDQKGSHKQFRHDEKPGRVTVPHPVKDLASGTLRSIEKQSGVDLG